MRPRVIRRRRDRKMGAAPTARHSSDSRRHRSPSRDRGRPQADDTKRDRARAGSHRNDIGKDLPGLLASSMAAEIPCSFRAQWHAPEHCAVCAKNNDFGAVVLAPGPVADTAADRHHFGPLGPKPQRRRVGLWDRLVLLVHGGWLDESGASRRMRSVDRLGFGRTSLA